MGIWQEGGVEGVFVLFSFFAFSLFPFLASSPRDTPEGAGPSRIPPCLSQRAAPDPLGGGRSAVDTLSDMLSLSYCFVM